MLRPPIERHRLRSVWYGKPRTFLPVPIKGKEALVFGYRTYMRGPLPDDLEYALAYGNDKSVFELADEDWLDNKNYSHVLPDWFLETRRI